MKYSVDEVIGDKDKNIAIRLSGEDIVFQASNYSLSVYLDKETADKIAFQIQSLLQDMDYRKNGYPAEKKA